MAFAKDVALVIIEEDINELKYVGDEGLEMVADRLSHHGICLAVEKTETVVIARTRRRRYVTLTVEAKGYGRWTALSTWGPL